MKNQEKIYITKMCIAILTFSRLLKSTKLYNLFSKKYISNTRLKDLGYRINF